MPDESVDIINEKDEVLYQTSKKEAHEKGLLHRCAIGFIKDSRNNWILVKQARGRQDAGQYVAPVGGHIMAGESSENALQREALEEVGLSNFKHKHVGQFIFNRFVLNRQENHYFIVYEIYTDNALVLNHESEDYRAFTQEELCHELAHNPKLFGNITHFEIKTIYPQLLGLK